MAENLEKDRLVSNFVSEMEKHSFEKDAPEISRASVSENLQVEMRKMDQTKMREREKGRIWNEKKILFESENPKITIKYLGDENFVREPHGKLTQSLLYGKGTLLQKHDSRDGTMFFRYLGARGRRLEEDVKKRDKLRAPNSSYFQDGIDFKKLEQQQKLQASVEAANRWLSQQKLDVEPKPDYSAADYQR